jgi:membrane dipeptidase
MTPTNSIPIFDGHNDTLLDLYHSNKGSPRSFFSQSDQGHLDLPRARKGGFGGGFFAIFTPTNGENDDDAASVDKALEISMAPAIDQAYAQQFTIALAAQLFRLEAEAEGQIKVVRTVDELTTCLDQGILATIFHIEGAEAIDPNKLDVPYTCFIRPGYAHWASSGAGLTPSAVGCRSCSPILPISVPV